MSEHNNSTDRKVAYVALDIGKNVSAYGIYEGKDATPLVPPRLFAVNQSDYDQIASQISELLNCGKYQRVVIGLEPTGVYHETLTRQLCDRFAAAMQTNAAVPLDFRFLNPYLTKQARAQHQGRRRKSDLIDVACIGRCLSENKGIPAFLPKDGDVELRLWERKFSRLRHEHRRHKLQLSTALDQLWPGALVNVKRFKKTHPKRAEPIPLVKTGGFDSVLVRAVIACTPDPNIIRDMSAVVLRAALHRNMQRCGIKTAQHVIDCATSGLLPPSDISARYASAFQSDFQEFLARDARIQQLADQAPALIAGTPAQVLTSIPGISAVLAARYYAGIGNPQRFMSAGQVWAFAGFDPRQDDSGDSRQRCAISKHGDSALRDTLYLIGFQTALHCPEIAATLQRAVARGLSRTAAVIHAAHKANRLCWHLMHFQEEYIAPNAP